MFTLEDKNNLPVQQPLLADNVECLTHMLITPAMIVTKIKKLKDNKSPVSLRLSLRLRVRRLYRPKPSYATHRVGLDLGLGVISNY